MRFWNYGTMSAKETKQFLKIAGRKRTPLGSLSMKKHSRKRTKMKAHISKSAKTTRRQDHTRMRLQPQLQDHKDRSKFDRKDNKDDQTINNQKIPYLYLKGYLTKAEGEPINKTEEQVRKVKDNTNQIPSQPRNHRAGTMRHRPTQKGW